MSAFEVLNPICPRCGGDLRATVDVRYKDVPLDVDGYVPTFGRQTRQEIVETHCSDCGWKEQGSRHYHTKMRIGVMPHGTYARDT